MSFTAVLLECGPEGFQPAMGSPTGDHPHRGIVAWRKRGLREAPPGRAETGKHQEFPYTPVRAFPDGT